MTPSFTIVACKPRVTLLVISPEQFRVDALNLPIWVNSP
jgi:hypothetical protein